MSNKEKIWMVVRDCVYDRYDPKYVKFYKGTLDNIQLYMKNEQPYELKEFEFTEVKITPITWEYSKEIKEKLKKERLERQRKIEEDKKYEKENRKKLLEEQIKILNLQLKFCEEQIKHS